MHIFTLSGSKYEVRYGRFLCHHHARWSRKPYGTTTHHTPLPPHGLRFVSRFSFKFFRTSIYRQDVN